jgi:dCMP deaminase
VLEAGRVNCQGATLYSSVYPCFLCAKIIVECRVKRVIYDKEYNSANTAKIFELANIEVIKWKQDFKKFI